MRFFSLFIFLLLTALCAVAGRPRSSFPRQEGQQATHRMVRSSSDSLTTPARQPRTLSDSLSRSANAADSLSPRLTSDSTSLRNLSTDSLANDSVKQDSVKPRKAGIDSPVEYIAQDSMVYDAASGLAHLYGEAKVNYLNMTLDAGKITMNMDSSMVYAEGQRDSTLEGGWKGRPVYHQGSEKYDSEKMSFNFKTKKGFISNVATTQGNGFLQSQKSKRTDDGTLYLEHAKYTTCDAKHPHFYLSLSRAKVRPGKEAFFGPAYLVVEDVPLPIAVPYGFFPFTKKYSSGFIMPSYGDETARGFYLRNGGYYLALSDFMDLKLLGEIYTKGSWGASIETNYIKRYKYSGNFYFSYLNTVEGEKNMPDYAVTKSMKIQWSHTKDAKANPNMTFSARVNFATENYERKNLESMYNPLSYTQSTRASSVSFGYTFPNIGLSLSTSANLSQNMRDGVVSATLPDLSISLARFYPFRRKHSAGKERWYEKISMSYTGQLSNSITTKESRLYGFYKPWKKLFGGKIMAIRHVFKPTISFSYAPDFTSSRYGYTKSYEKVLADGTSQAVRYSPYAGNLYGYPSGTKQGMITMSVSNNIEMKVKSDRDTTGMRKISLIDELSGTLSYNMAAKKQPWSPLNMRVRLKLTKNYTFSMAAVFATYAYKFDENGNVVPSDRTEWSYGRFGRFQGMSQNISYTFNNQTWRKWMDKLRGKKDETATTDESTSAEETSLEDANIDPDLLEAKRSKNKKKEKAKVDKDGYMTFSIPWSLTLSYGITMAEDRTKQINVRRMRYPFSFTQTLNASGYVRFSEGWNVSFSSGYDFEQKKLSMTTMSLSRDLHCFEMSASVVLKPYSSFNFTFRARASELADALKWDKRSSYSTNIEWY